MEAINDRMSPRWNHPRRQVFARMRRCLEQLLAERDDLRGETLVDYGCGEMPYRALFAARFRKYVGVDVPGNPAADLIVPPDTSLPFDDNSVDCVLSTQVFEHVPNPCRYLTEARRILKQGGLLVLSTHGIWRYHPHPSDYWRWTRSGLELQIERSGFEVMKIQGILGLRSTALQLWQDATISSLPRCLRPCYAGFMQALIGGLEALRRSDKDLNASTFVALALKPGKDGSTVPHMNHP